MKFTVRGLPGLPYDVYHTNKLRQFCLINSRIQRPSFPGSGEVSRRRLLFDPTTISTQCSGMCAPWNLHNHVSKTTDIESTRISIRRSADSPHKHPKSEFDFRHSIIRTWIFNQRPIPKYRSQLLYVQQKL